MAKVDNGVEFLNEKIFNEIALEREFQQNILGYTQSVDDFNNTPIEWVAYITSYATTWWTKRWKAPNDVLKAFRVSMIKVAALAVAAIESTDRELERRKENG